MVTESVIITAIICFTIICVVYIASKTVLNEQQMNTTYKEEPKDGNNDE